VGEREDKYGKTTLGCTPQCPIATFGFSRRPLPRSYRPFIRAIFEVRLGVRFDPFAEPSGKARSLRTAVSMIRKLCGIVGSRPA
jgi:hypothetical protein